MADGFQFAGSVQKDRSVEVITLGCRLNACESQVIREQAALDGVTDVVVVNTCAVTAEAVRQSRQAIRKARRERPESRLVVTGCAVQIDPGSFTAMREVDLVIGNDEKRRPGALQDGGSRTRVGDIFGARQLTGRRVAGLAERARAHVEIQNGCDHRCTFCVIPQGRGDSRSVPAGDVVSQVRSLAESGFNEVVLTGVDLTSWGADLPGSPDLAGLIRRILKGVPELPRIRLSSIDTAEVNDNLMGCLVDEPRVMPHLHLSLQSGDDLILKRMKRRHGRADAIGLVERLRRHRPDMVFGADLIAGFPTESDAAFENSLSLIRDAGLTFIHVFPFSPRPGTPAARMPQVDPTIVKVRASRLRDEGDMALRRHLNGIVGRPLRALVERQGRARAEDFTEVEFSGEATVGGMIAGLVSGHDNRRARVDVWSSAP